MRCLLLFIMTLFAHLFVNGQDVATFKINPVQGAGITPVFVSLDEVNVTGGQGCVALFEAAEPGNEVFSQYEPGVNPGLWFMFDNARGEKEYVIRKVGDGVQKPGITSIEEGDGFTTIQVNNRPVLNYQHQDVYPPENVDDRYHRSAFIHPLYSPGGAVLTRVQPPDHYHHYGIWNPWTSTTINGDIDVDFWNLSKGEGRVRFGGYLAREAGSIYAGLKVRHEHVAYVGKADVEELIAINESWDVRAWNTGHENVNMIDLVTTLNSPLPDGILLNAYRYGGGIGYRATGKWNGENTRLLTSEGKERDEMDATTARWCLIEGETQVEEGRSGIVFMSHPSNYSHPEPIRMWPAEESAGKGKIFFMFTPTRENSWKLEPRESYSLRYRLIVYDGDMPVEEIEKYWKAFSRSPGVCFK